MILELSGEFPVNLLCETMNNNRSSFYYWKKHLNSPAPSTKSRAIREEFFQNLLSAELNIDGPLQCVVSDMTAFYVKGIYYELTLYMDLWNTYR